MLGSAAANYFMYSYGVVIDGNMMQNAFETNTQEATALLTPRMGLWLALLGVLPAVAVCFAHIRQTRPWWYMVGLRAANVMLSLVVILIVAALFYKDYASLIRNNKKRGEDVDAFQLRRRHAQIYRTALFHPQSAAGKNR